MKIIIINIIFLLFFLFLFNSPLKPQVDRRIELTAQEILARVDKILDYPEGSVKGKMIHITPDGRSKAIELNGFIADEDFLFKFSSKERGEELRVLYKQNGEDIWVYNSHAIKLFNKRGIDKYDSIMTTNYCFLDLSNADFQSNYAAIITGDAFIKGKDTYRLDLSPIFREGNYGLLTLYVSKEDFIPMRIDFHDNDKIIFKTLSIVKVVTTDSRIVPVRYDMLHIKRGTVTLLEFFGFEEDMKFDKKIFRPQSLGEK